MSIETAQPAPTYEGLLRQFHALKTVAIGLERMLGEKGKDWQIDKEARDTLDSERQANALLTAEVEGLRSQLAGSRCAGCRHFEVGAMSIRSGFGKCARWLEGYTWRLEDLMLNDAWVENDEGWGNVVGPEFGCVLFEKQT